MIEFSLVDANIPWRFNKNDFGGPTNSCKELGDRVNGGL